MKKLGRREEFMGWPWASPRQLQAHHSMCSHPPAQSGNHPLCMHAMVFLQHWLSDCKFRFRDSLSMSCYCISLIRFACIPSTMVHILCILTHHVYRADETSTTGGPRKAWRP